MNNGGRFDRGIVPSRHSSEPTEVSRGSSFSTLPQVAVPSARVAALLASPTVRSHIGGEKQRHPRTAPARRSTHEKEFEHVSLDQAFSFFDSYQESGERSELDRAVRGFRFVLRGTVASQPSVVACQHFLCAALTERFDLFGSDEDIAEAVQSGEDALSENAATPSADQAQLARSCARAHILRYEGFSRGEDIKRAVSLMESARSLSSDADAYFLLWQGRALFFQYEAFSRLQSLEESIGCFTRVLERLPADDMARPLCMYFLSESHRRRLDKLNDVSDLTDLVTFARSAVAIARVNDPRRPRYLNVLAVSLQRSWLLTEDANVLHESIAFSKQALATVNIGDRKHTAVLTTLANGLRYRFQMLGDLEDINECVELQEASMTMRDRQHSSYNAGLHGLSLSLLYRFRNTGHIHDIDRAITALQDRIAEVPRSSSQRAHLLNILSAALLERYHLFRSLPDLLDSLEMSKEVSDAIPSNGGFLGNVGECFYELYQRCKEDDKLEKAIEYMGRADHKLQSINDLPEHYVSFARALIARACLFGRSSDWEDGLDYLRRAVQHAPLGHRRRPLTRRVLGSALKDRFQALKNRADIVESLAVLEDCLTKDATGFEKTRCAVDLAEARVVYRDTIGSRDTPIAELRLLQQAAKDTDGLINDRFDAALRWARLAQQHGLSHTVYEAYCLAVGLLPRVAWLGFGKDVCLEELRGQAASLAPDAAAAAIEVGQFDKAVELLESGRGILWSQLLQLRTEVDELREIAPEIATEMQDVGRALEADVSNSGGLEAERLLQQQRRLAERWEALVEDVRKLKGMHMFLRAATFAQLSEAAEEGPVVIFNASVIRCDALIITPDRRNYHCPSTRNEHGHGEPTFIIPQTRFERS